MRGFVVLLLSLVALSCSKYGYVDMVSVSPECWDSAVSILYTNEDTTSLRDLSVALRYNSDFKSDTLSVFVQTSLPDGYQFREQTTLCLSRKYTASAVTASEAVPYRSNCTLDREGYYIFTITPCHPVEGIEAVGIEISENGKR